MTQVQVFTDFDGTLSLDGKKKNLDRGTQKVDLISFSRYWSLINR